MKLLARADSGFYCWEAVAAYEQAHCQFVTVARKTRRLVEQLQQAEWKPSPHSDAAAECEFLYQPQGWGRACRFVALRYEKEPETEEVEQYQLFATSAYTYRVFVTNLAEPIAAVVWFYNQRAGAENLIKEANNDAELAAHPSRRFDTNRNHFQLVMLAYNLNCWLLLFQREADAPRRSCGTPPWRRRGRAFCSWRPRSGGTPAERASATAISTRSRACSSG